jgi:hypothetical protein
MFVLTGGLLGLILYIAIQLCGAAQMDILRAYPKIALACTKERIPKIHGFKGLRHRRTQSP